MVSWGGYLRLYVAMGRRGDIGKEVQREKARRLVACAMFMSQFLLIFLEHVPFGLCERQKEQ